MDTLERQDQEAERQRDAAAGFRETTVADVIIDYKSMDDDTRIIVTGYYSTVGQVGMISGEEYSLSSIAVMPDRLSRETRKALLDCVNCKVTVWAHHGCTFTVLNQKTGAPCFVADRLKMGS